MSVHTDVSRLRSKKGKIRIVVQSLPPSQSVSMKLPLCNSDLKISKRGWVSGSGSVALVASVTIEGRLNMPLQQMF